MNMKTQSLPLQPAAPSQPAASQARKAINNNIARIIAREYNKKTALLTPGSPCETAPFLLPPLPKNSSNTEHTEKLSSYTLSTCLLHKVKLQMTMIYSAIAGSYWALIIQGRGGKLMASFSHFFFLVQWKSKSMGEGKKAIHMPDYYTHRGK